MKKEKKIKVWWLRKGKEGFLVSNLWRNGANARFTARGKNLNLKGSHLKTGKYTVIPCTLTFKE